MEYEGICDNMNPAWVYLIKSVVLECLSDILAVGVVVGSGEWGLLLYLY